jgi:hypothetical protein
MGLSVVMKYVRVSIHTTAMTSIYSSCEWIEYSKFICHHSCFGIIANLHNWEFVSWTCLIQNLPGHSHCPSRINFPILSFSKSKGIGKSKVVLVLFLNWAPCHEGVLGEWEWSASRPGRFTPGERARGTHCIGGWVGPRACLDTVVKREIRGPCWDSNPDHPARSTAFTAELSLFIC